MGKTAVKWRPVPTRSIFDANKKPNCLSPAEERRGECLPESNAPVVPGQYGITRAILEGAYPAPSSLSCPFLLLFVE